MQGQLEDLAKRGRGQLDNSWASSTERDIARFRGVRGKASSRAPQTPPSLQPITPEFLHSLCWRTQISTFAGLPLLFEVQLQAHSGHYLPCLPLLFLWLCLPPALLQCMLVPGTLPASARETQGAGIVREGWALSSECRGRLVGLPFSCLTRRGTLWESSLKEGALGPWGTIAF